MKIDNREVSKMGMSKTVAAMAAGLGLLMAAGAASAGGLDGKSIKRIFPGQFEAKVQGYRVYFAGYSNGGLAGQAYGQEDQGRWYVNGNTLCVSWKKWTKGKAKCGSIAQQGGWFVASNGAGEVLKFRRALVAQQ